ncbi:hypothetical protein CGRA01v4_10852 [Colletotrichum graminicola]|nr:hypothetical protein CGRA01v4_10852 [Colletotrichum graminicola]
MVHVTGDQEDAKISPCLAILPNKSLSRRVCVWLSLGAARSRVMACSVSNLDLGVCDDHGSHAIIGRHSR